MCVWVRVRTADYLRYGIVTKSQERLGHEYGRLCRRFSKHVIDSFSNFLPYIQRRRISDEDT